MSLDAVASAKASAVTTGFRQLMVSASATAMRRLPTPEPPANSKAGGSVSRATARDSSETIRRWPMMSRKGTWVDYPTVPSYHEDHEGIEGREEIGFTRRNGATEESGCRS